MKKLLVLFGLLGIFGTAMAQTASDVTFTVDFFCAVTIDTEPSMTITDGGFAGPYATTNGIYSVSSNAGWLMEGAASGLVTPGGSSGVWVLVDIDVDADFGSAGASPGETFNASLSSATAGHYLGVGDVTGTITLTCTSS